MILVSARLTNESEICKFALIFYNTRHSCIEFSNHSNVVQILLNILH